MDFVYCNFFWLVVFWSWEGLIVDRVVLMFLMFFVGVLLVVGLNTFQHELVHKQIFLYDGCGEVVVRWGLVSSVSCVDSSYVESGVAVSEHSFNEVIGYNSQSMILLVALCGFTVLSLWGLRYDC